MSLEAVWEIKDGGFVANINKLSFLLSEKMVKHKVTVNFGPYMSCGIVEHRTARLEGLQGKWLMRHITFQSPTDCTHLGTSVQKKKFYQV